MKVPDGVRSGEPSFGMAGNHDELTVSPTFGNSLKTHHLHPVPLVLVVVYGTSPPSNGTSCCLGFDISPKPRTRSNFSFSSS